MLYKVVYSIGPTDGYEVFNTLASAQDFYDKIADNFDEGMSEDDWIDIREISSSLRSKEVEE